jgi:hypothetical protein
MSEQELNITSRSNILLFLSMMALLIGFFLLPRETHMFIASGVVLVFFMCIVFR